MTQFFLSVHREKKLSHFDLKIWVTGGIKIRPNFLGQNDSIFSLSAPREKLSHSDPKSWLTGGTKIKIITQFFAQCTERNTWVILTLKVESLGQLKFDPTFQVKMTPFFLSAPIEKIESFWPKMLSHWRN